jgi:hypothetical protein
MSKTTIIKKMPSRSRKTDHPSPEHSVSDHVFDIGESDIVLLQERTDVTGHMRYVVRFKDAEPTGAAVEETIELMRVFADITWDFELLCDLRATKLAIQIAHAPAYSRLVSLIRNPHCKHCYVYMRPAPPLVAGTIGKIVAAMGVPCTMVKTKRSDTEIQ